MSNTEDYATYIECPAPNCDVKWSSTTPQTILLKLLEIHERTAHPTTTPATTSTTTGARVEKVKRPIISAAGTSEEWSYFVSRWTDYKNATRLTGDDTIFQLLECCDEALRKDLTRTYVSLTSSDEITLLGRIKSLAVRQENVMVARLELQQMRQDRDEPARAFYARLKGQSSVCQFKVKCTQCGLENSYCDNMVRDNLITGLADDDIRLEVLGQSNQEMSLDETIRFIEAKESGKLSAIRIKPQPPPISINASSTYKQTDRKRLQSQLPDKKFGATPCGHCGATGHGRRRQDRMNQCPAFNHTCTKCRLPHHFENVCRKSKQTRKPLGTQRDDNATAVYEALCFMENEHSPHEPTMASTITLEHHIYDSLCDAWRKRSSDPQPAVQVNVQALPSDAKDLGVKPTINQGTKEVKVQAIADTGCQSCLVALPSYTSLV